MVKFLNKCAEIELQAAQIYFVFSANPNCDQTLAKIWGTMARDEENHAAQLRLAMRLPMNESFEKLKEGIADPDELFQVARQIESRARGSVLSVLEMLKTAVVLEREFRKLHATYVLTFKDPKLLDVFQRLARADEQHVGELQEYIKLFKEQHQPQ